MLSIVLVLSTWWCSIVHSMSCFFLSKKRINVCDIVRWMEGNYLKTKAHQYFSFSSGETLIHLTLEWDRKANFFPFHRLYSWMDNRIQKDEETDWTTTIGHKRGKKRRLRATPPGGVKIQNNTTWWSVWEKKRKNNKKIKMIINMRQNGNVFL